MNQNEPIFLNLYMRKEELLGCQNLNLYEGALWQLLYSYGRTSWIWLAEELGINLNWTI